MEETATSEKKDVKQTRSKNLLLVGAFALVVGIILGYIIIPPILSPQQPKQGTSTVNMSNLSNKVEGYITENFLSAYGASAKVKNYSEYEGVIKFGIEIIQNNKVVSGGEVFTTKDGGIIIVGAMYNTSVPIPKQNFEEKVDIKSACAALEKKERPLLQAFVVSYCPYGVQMQRILVPVAQVLKENCEIRYIGAIVDGNVTSMHGEREATENLRQICIREEQKEKYWEYVSCFIKKGDVESCLTNVSINKTMLDGCMNDSNRGIKYAEVDFTLSDQYEVTGSPSLILDGQQVSEFDFGGRNPEAIKKLICCSLAKEREVCNQTLESREAATGFSETYLESGGESSGGSQC